MVFNISSVPMDLFKFIFYLGRSQRYKSQNKNSFTFPQWLNTQHFLLQILLQKTTLKKVFFKIRFTFLGWLNKHFVNLSQLMEIFRL